MLVINSSYVIKRLMHKCINTFFNILFLLNLRFHTMFRFMNKTLLANHFSLLQKSLLKGMYHSLVAVVSITRV